MKDANILKTGIIGSVIAAVCCTTPILVVALGAFGLWPGSGGSTMRSFQRSSCFSRSPLMGCGGGGRRAAAHFARKT